MTWNMPKLGDRFRTRKVIGDPILIGHIPEGTELVVRGFRDDGQPILVFDEPSLVLDDSGALVPGTVARAVSYPPDLHDDYFELVEEVPDAG